MTEPREELKLAHQGGHSKVERTARAQVLWKREGGGFQSCRKLKGMQ